MHANENVNFIELKLYSKVIYHLSSFIPFKLLYFPLLHFLGFINITSLLRAKKKSLNFVKWNQV